MDEYYRRKLTELEQDVLDFIAQNPGLTPADIANQYSNNPAAWSAIYYLSFNAYTETDRTTGTIIKQETK